MGKQRSPLVPVGGKWRVTFALLTGLLVTVLANGQVIRSEMAEGPFRVVIASQPQPIVARYPFLFRIQVTELLEQADPLLGSEVPASCQVSVEIRSADGSHLLAGPVLIPPQEKQAEIFALSYRFQSAGPMVANG